MSEQETKQPTTRRRSSIIEVESDEDIAIELSSSDQQRRDSIIEVLSDAGLDNSDDELEIVGEAQAPPVEDDDLQITGQTRMVPPTIQYPGAPMEAVPVDGEPYNSRDSSHTPPTPAPPRRQRHLFGREFMRRLRRRVSGETGHRFTRPLSFFDLPQEHQRSFLDMIQSQDDDEISSSIFARLEREDELALDRKIEKEKIFNRDALQKKKREAKEEDNLHTTNIDPKDNLLCELCGIQLGEGIPDDFKPNPKYDKDLEKYAKEFQVQAPWFCMTQCLEADRALSKRVFVAKCGHVFCGRCIKNIGNRPPGRRPKKQTTQISLDNPLISAPRRCPASGCSHQFSRGKRAFTELFL